MMCPKSSSHKAFSRSSFGLKMSIKCCSSHICGIDNFLYCNFVIAFFGQESAECSKNGCPCFLLSSVHDNSFRTIFQKCSIRNMGDGIIHCISFVYLLTIKRTKCLLSNLLYGKMQMSVKRTNCCVWNNYSSHLTELEGLLC